VFTLLLENLRVQIQTVALVSRHMVEPASPGVRSGIVACGFAAVECWCHQLWRFPTHFVTMSGAYITSHLSGDIAHIAGLYQPSVAYDCVTL